MVDMRLDVIYIYIYGDTYIYEIYARVLTYGNMHGFNTYALCYSITFGS
jgi:hypothetical protein